jgi:TPR repeat protein
VGALITETQRNNESSSKMISQSSFDTPTRQYKYNVTLCEGSKISSSHEEEESEPQRFERTLALHRAKIATYRSNWEYKMPGAATSSAVTPSRSWPDDVPPDDVLPMLLNDIQYCSRSPNFRSDKGFCNRLSFRVASALITQFDETQQRQGLEMLKSLAEKGYADGMCYYGMCINEGRGGVEPNPVGAVGWFRRCSDMYDHAQRSVRVSLEWKFGTESNFVY